MKKLKRILLLLLVCITLNFGDIFAQDAPPPPPDHIETGNQIGGNAPIDHGSIILLIICVAYGAIKLYDLKKRKTVFLAEKN